MKKEILRRQKPWPTAIAGAQNSVKRKSRKPTTRWLRSFASTSTGAILPLTTARNCASICGLTSYRIWLIPIWLLDVIPAGTELTSISGEKVVFNTKEDIDIDTRCGCLTYGIYPKAASNEAE